MVDVFRERAYFLPAQRKSPSKTGRGRGLARTYIRWIRAADTQKWRMALEERSRATFYPRQVRSHALEPVVLIEAKDNVLIRLFINERLAHFNGIVVVLGVTSDALC